MPLYEYQCETCQKLFEQLRSIAQADAPQQCPLCGSAKVRRKLSLVNAISDGKSIASSASSCGSCSSGNCSSCGN